MSGLRQAVSFLTRVPVGATGGVDRAAAWFPAVGALIGLAVAGVYAALYPWMPTLLAGVIALGVGVVVTGALHEDGLADSFDALGSGARGEDALRIMSDSRLGTYGTTALVFSLVWRMLAVASLTQEAAIAGLVMAHTLGRTGAVSLMAVAPSARAEGLASAGIGSITTRAAWAGVLSGLAISSLAAGWWVGPAVVLAALTVVVSRAVALSRLGGVTGDVLGACEQILEMGVLAIVATAAWGGWQPWWAG